MDGSEGSLREELSAALRLAVHFDLHEGIDNHFSVVLPGPHERYLINPEGFHWAELGPDDLLICDGDGRVLEGQGEVEATALHIHVQTHRARPDAKCIMHTHMPYATAITCVDEGRFRFVHQNSLRFWNRVAYDPIYGGLALDAAEGARIAALASEGDIIFLAHHGVMVLGGSVAEAFEDLFFLEKACRVQAIAAGMGALKDIEADAAVATAGQMRDIRKRGAELHFAALRRMMAAGTIAA